MSNDQSHRRYTIVWARLDGEQQTCSGLTVTTAAARLLRALQASGPITIVSVQRERAAICGSIYPGPERDCLCLEPPHDAETPHECNAPGCGRQWTSKPVGRAA